MSEGASDCLDSLLLRLDFGAVHQPTIWHVQTPQSRSDHCRKARVQRVAENRNDSCDPNWNSHPHGNSPDARSCPQSPNASTAGEAAISRMARTNAREDPLHAQAQLCRQLQQLATHFPLQNQKYARNTPLNALRRSISFALPSRDFASLSAVCNEIALLKTKHFTPRLLTTGLHVRIRTGEPLRFTNITDTRERCESAKRM
jgi:hypothetical protein